MYFKLQLSEKDCCALRYCLNLYLNKQLPLQNLSAVFLTQQYHPVLTCGLSPWLQETRATSLYMKTQNCALATATKKQLPPLLRDASTKVF